MSRGIVSATPNIATIPPIVLFMMGHTLNGNLADMEKIGMNKMNKKSRNKYMRVYLENEDTLKN